MSILSDDTIDLMDQAMIVVEEDEETGLLKNAEYFGEVEEPPEDPPPTDERTEGLGCLYGLIVVFLIALAALFAGIYLFATDPPDLIQGWLTKDPTATPFVLDEGMKIELSQADVEALCIETGYMVRADTLQETCDDYCQAEYQVSDLMCPGCPVCPERYQLPPEQEPQMLTEYLDTAEIIIQAMYDIQSRMEVLAEMIQSVEGHASQLGVMDSNQYQELKKEMLDRLDRLNGTLRSTWPPGPYDSSNPLLDAHGRMLNAYLYLEAMRENFYEAEVYRRPGFVGTNLLTSTAFEYMEREISYARTGLSLAR